MNNFSFYFQKSFTELTPSSNGMCANVLFVLFEPRVSRTGLTLIAIWSKVRSVFKATYVKSIYLSKVLANIYFENLLNRF